MKLGDAFPTEIAAESITRQLRPGSVVKFRAIMDDGKEHEKRFVVLYVDEHTLVCVVNSEISKFIQNRPDMLQCQVAMDGENHSYMSHDSYIDCSRIRQYSTREVHRQLRIDPSWILGDITDALRSDITSALKHSTLESPKLVQKCCQSLEEAEL